MNNRLSKTEYLVAYMIIISLACFVGGFFLGAKVMKSNMIQAMEEARKLEEAVKQPKPYREQDFVVFYHSVLRPVQDFAEQHGRLLVTLTEHPENAHDQLDEIRSAAERTKAEISRAKLPGTSPLLLRSRDGYTASLEAYLEALDRYADSRDADSASFKAFLDPFSIKWLRAQTDWYRAVSLWEEQHVTKKPMHTQPADTYTFAEWQSFPFHYRNYLSADILLKEKRLVSYRPEDLTAHIDQLIHSRQAGELGLKNVTEAVRVLTATNAVRNGDFRAMKRQLYPELQAPQVPVFTE